MARKERYLVGLDVGTSKTTAIVGEPGDERQPEHRRHGRGRVARDPARPGGQPRDGRRLDQEGGRRGRADGGHRDRQRLPRALRARTSRGSTAAASWPWPARTARSPTRTWAARSTPRRRCRCRPAGRSCTCCRRTSWWTTRTGSATPVGMTGARLEVNVHVVTGSVTATQNIVACVNRAGVQVQGTVLGQLAASDAVLTAGREGPGRGAPGHRRRNDRPRDLRARQPLAHGRDRCGRRPLHQRHRGRACGCRSRRPSG